MLISFFLLPQLTIPTSPLVICAQKTVAFPLVAKITGSQAPRSYFFLVCAPTRRTRKHCSIGEGSGTSGVFRPAVTTVKERCGHDGSWFMDASRIHRSHRSTLPPLPRIALASSLDTRNKFEDDSESPEATRRPCVESLSNKGGIF